jgi:ATP-binding cassette subfamily F protein 3
VSHDRYFISQVANKIVEIRDGEFRVYLGDYHYYLTKIEEEKQQAKLAAKKAAKTTKAGAKKK